MAMSCHPLSRNVKCGSALDRIGYTDKRSVSKVQWYAGLAGTHPSGAGVAQYAIDRGRSQTHFMRSKDHDLRIRLYLLQSPVGG